MSSEEKKSKFDQSTMMQTNEARAIMYIVPVVIVLAIIAYLFRQ